jgi:hypothetical protein
MSQNQAVVQSLVRLAHRQRQGGDVDVPGLLVAGLDSSAGLLSRY